MSPHLVVIFMLSFPILLLQFFYRLNEKLLLQNLLIYEIFNREIYHCPYCNLCRVGKGLGVDYFHCMNCNACMSRSLMVHTCREKSLEDNCPICHEYIFTSCNPVKALPCGHVMHSTCFQVLPCIFFSLFPQICRKYRATLVVFVMILPGICLL